jgi:hypothetical protein
MLVMTSPAMSPAAAARDPAATDSTTMNPGVSAVGGTARPSTPIDPGDPPSASRDATADASEASMAKERAPGSWVP